MSTKPLAKHLQQVIDEYEGGFKGCSYSEAAARSLQATVEANGQTFDGHEACLSNGLTPQAMLALPFMAAEKLFPGCFPGGAQGRGSCVAWSTRNAAWGSYCADLLYGENEDRGSAPELSPVAIDNGCVSTEAIYWYRGKDSDGWFCDAAVEVALNKAGLVLRKNYPELGFDLTEYSARTEGKWGSIPPPPDVRDATDNNLVKNATKVNTWEDVCAMLVNGYCLTTCGSEAFSKRRNAYGICDRTSGTWYHAMAVTGLDSRQETIEREGCGLLLVQNSWGDYVSGADVIWGTNIRIPTGSFWARWDDFKRRQMIALGPSHGWPAKQLPDWGLRDIL